MWLTCSPQLKLVSKLCFSHIILKWFPLDHFSIIPIIWLISYNLTIKSHQHKENLKTSSLFSIQQVSYISLPSHTRICQRWGRWVWSWWRTAVQSAPACPSSRAQTSARGPLHLGGAPLETTEEIRWTRFCDMCITRMKTVTLLQNVTNNSSCHRSDTKFKGQITLGWNNAPCTSTLHVYNILVCKVSFCYDLVNHSTNLLHVHHSQDKLMAN